MPVSRWACVILACATLPAVGQQPSTPTPESNPPSVQPEAAPAPDKLMHIGDRHVQKPIVISSVPPQFSEEAKHAKYSGHVLVYLFVDKEGNPTHVRVVKSEGMGLDEKAVEAVRQYKFKPATFMGQPVTVDLYVDVNFQILDR
jgi:TonB family protein